MFGIDELFGLELAGLYGTIGKTNFGDIDVNKPLVVSRLNDVGKDGTGMRKLRCSKLMAAPR